MSKLASEIVNNIRDMFITFIFGGLSDDGKRWFRPWKKIMSMPTNAATGKIFSGTNFLILLMYGGGLFATYRQYKDKLGGKVNWDTATPIHLLRPLMRKTKNATTGIEETKLYGFAGYKVFSVNDQTGYVPPTETPQIDFTPIPELERIVKALGVKIVHGGNRACYIPSMKVIHMPAPEMFNSVSDYYAVLFHEIIHWTGSKDILDRKLDSARFGDEAYSYEELIAEIGTTMLLTHLGVSQPVEMRDNHVRYVKHWLTILKGDASSITTACSKAQAACNHVLKQVA